MDINAEAARLRKQAAAQRGVGQRASDIENRQQAREERELARVLAYINQLGELFAAWVKRAGIPATPLVMESYSTLMSRFTGKNRTRPRVKGWKLDEIHEQELTSDYPQPREGRHILGVSTDGTLQWHHLASSYGEVPEIRSRHDVDYVIHCIIKFVAESGSDVPFPDIPPLEG